MAAAISGLIGGGLIGLAAVLLMLSLGRIAGICGILSGLLTTRFDADARWRANFLIGLTAGALLTGVIGLKDWASLTFETGYAGTIVAGLLVGVGTVLGSGCTSGHGICGMARLSGRSVAATATFMATAALTVFILRHVL